MPKLMNPLPLLVVIGYFLALIWLFTAFPSVIAVAIVLGTTATGLIVISCLG